MPDITACNDDKCPLKETCYRYKCNKNELGQSYFLDSPRKGKKCEHYWEIKQ